jgi:phenolic acid decarboxylase
MTKPIQNFSGIIGKHILYKYDNGWRYEYYFRNETSGDYRIHSGIVGGRWVTKQPLCINALGHDIFKVSWHEPTGTNVSLTVSFNERWLHGWVVFPRWVAEEPQKTVCYQNDCLPLMQSYRDNGSTYPAEIVNEFAEITFLEECGRDRDDVIDCPLSALPAGYAERRN